MGIVGLNINTNIEVKLEEEIFKSIVQAIEDDKFFIAMPMKNGQYLLPHIQDKIEISYVDKDCVYSFYTEVIGRLKENIPLLILKNPDKVNKAQRRKFVRVPVVQNIKYWELNATEIEKFKKTPIAPKYETLKGVLLDLSGGGARLILEGKLHLNSFILLDIPMKNDTLLVPGKIMWIDRDEMGRTLYGVNFELISETIRDKIIKNTFEIMRKQRKRI